MEWPTHVLSSSPQPVNKIFVPLSRFRSSRHQQGQRGRWRWSTPHHCHLSSGCQLLPSFSLRLHGQYDIAPPSANEKSLSYRHQFHVIVAAARAKERWFGAMRGHHRRAGPTSSPLDGAFELPSRSAKKSANSQPAIQLRSTAQQRGVRCGNIFSCFMYVA